MKPIPYKLDDKEQYMKRMQEIRDELEERK